ncbi:hypothetical protein [Micromonospora sp. NPDC049799]|uniref:hypothetical protein n=1 Tax=Micromonospora sp. NPDC049799 TaxID=3154741 RepID=UPI0033CF8A83
MPAARHRRNPRRFLTAGLATLLTATGAVVCAAQPATAGVRQWVLPVNVSHTDARQPTTAFPVTDGDVPVGTWEADGVKHTARAYFTFDLTAYRGKQVIHAEIQTGETSVGDCAKPRELELWRTDTPTAPPTWNTAPAVREKVADIGPTAPCPTTYLESWIVETVRQAVADGNESLTLMARIKGDHEESKHYGRRIEKPGMSLEVNGAPDVPSALTVAGLACADDRFVGTTTPILSAQVTDPDKVEPYAGDQVTATFAWWPVDRPTERTEWTSSAISAPRRFSYTVPGGLMANGGTYAFAVRASDQHATSDWSPECRFTVDTVRPPAPTVVSADYPAGWSYPGHGGPGIPGTFTFTSAADDVVGYRYGPSGATTYVPAGPDGSATISHAPDSYGSARLYVQAVDRTGNRSAQTIYEFRVRNTAPTVVDGNPDARLGQPRTFNLSPNMADVLEYVWRLNDGTERTVAANADGTATVTATPTETRNVLHVRSKTRDGVLSGDAAYTFWVRTAPFVSSPQWPFDGTTGAPAGTEGTFVFAPAMDGVTEYVYTINYGDPQTVAAGPDGSATVTYTPTDAGYHTIEVFSRTGDGVTSTSTGVAFYPASVAPRVRSEVYPSIATGGGPGVPGTFTFTPHAQVTGVTSYVYQFRDEPERTVAANPDGTATIEWTPTTLNSEYDGWVELRVRARTAAGQTTDAQYYSFRVDPKSPLVTSEVFGWQGGATVGQTGDFVLTAQLPGTTEFVYSFDGGPEQSVAANADGTAQVVWTPLTAYSHDLTVRSRTAAGVTSGAAYYSIWIDS